jgi:general secretion pathway protein F
MPWYAYSALSKVGAPISGETEAASRAAVVDWLLGLGHTPLDIKERGQKKTRGLALQSKDALTSGERLQVTRELASLLEAGISLERSLRILAELLARPKARSLMTSVLERLRSGQSLARAMEVSEASFPPYYVGLVAAGEASGRLKENMTALATSLDRTMQLRERVTSALLYPALLLVMTGVTFVLLVTVVLPRLKPLFSEAGAALPLPTRIVLGLGDFVQDYGWVLFGLFLFGTILFSEMLKMPAVRVGIDRTLLRLPLLLGLVQKSETAAFSRSLGTLLEAGLPMPAALSRVQSTLQNRAMTGAIGDVLAHVREGSSLSKALARPKLFPRMALELIHIGEETGALPHMLGRIADVYEREVTSTLERLVSLLVPAVTIGMGLMVGGLVASVLVGIMSLNDLAV